MRNILLLLGLILLSLLSACSTSIAGATSETTNGSVSATVVNLDGDVEVGALVSLRHRAFHSQDTAHTTTDSNGVFKFDSITEGNYTIEVVAPKSGFRTKTDWNSAEESSLPTPYLVVKSPGRLFGMVSPAKDQATITLAGLNRQALSDTLGYFSFDSLPDGPLEFLIATKTRDTVLIDTITIKSGQAVNLGTLDTRSAFTKDSVIVADILSLNDIDKSVKSVTVVRSGRIAELRINKLNLDILPPSIMNLRLEVLSLAQNDLIALPPEIGDITTLISIDVSDNELQDLPTSLGKLTACEYLDVASNNLKELPEQLLQMTSMRKLYVNKNHLTSLPSNIYEWVDEYSIDDTWEKSQTLAP